MVQINFALKEVNCKIVYYGPGLSGKTTNLEVVHAKAPNQNVGELTSIATEGDRTLFFDFLPLNLGKVAGMNTKFQIYTVPGQVYYNSTRKLVLQGADGIVFVADSRRSKMDENLESLHNLEDNLTEYGMDINAIPLVLQYNKRDLDDVLSVEEIDQQLNRFGSPFFEAVAVKGDGVFPTLKKLSSMVLEKLNDQQANTPGSNISKRSTAEPRQPVMAGTPEKASGAAVGRTSARTPSQTTGRGRVLKKAPGGPPRTKKVRETVTRSPGIKPIERKVPVRDAARRRRTRAAPPPPPPSGEKTGAATRILFAVLAAAGAAIYFSGAWKKFF